MTRMTGPDCVVMCNLINTYIHTYIHTYMAIICSKSKDQPGKVANPARGQLNRDDELFLVPVRA